MNENKEGITTTFTGLVYKAALLFTTVYQKLIEFIAIPSNQQTIPAGWTWKLENLKTEKVLSSHE